MWINSKYNSRQKYITPDVNLLISKIKDWHAGNPECNINVWYDSKMLSQNAITNTREILDGQITSLLLDIRDIPDVKDNEKIFSEKIPVYFRADLSRVIAANYYLRETGTKYFVYADLDVEPMDKNKLFDTDTMEILDKTGIVLAQHDITQFENSFQIISNNPHTLLALQHIIINLNILRAKNALRGNFKQIDDLLSSPIKCLTESVFYSYYPMLKYLYHLRGYGKLCVVSNLEDMKNGIHMDEDDSYSYETHGLEYFCPTYFAKGTTTTNRLFYSRKEPFVFPVKQVVMPNVKGYYDFYLPDSEKNWWCKIISWLHK